MARLPGIAAPITEDQFTTRAFERPSTFRESFGAGAADAALQSPGLGTVIREGQAPPLARSMDTRGSGLSSGRGGVAWKYETPQEVADKGDTLYENDNDFKKSPSYRPEIAFEKGMTESRAKALADMNDLSKVRQYYASKRPVAAFLGGVAGSALDPVNYIPIAGEVAQAAAVARVGRVAGRVLTTSTDAALNSVLFQTALSGQKAKYGDDVSWAAIAMNAAFAAMGGAVIGGAVGGWAKFRGWDLPEIKAPEVETIAPKADTGQTVPDIPRTETDTLSKSDTGGKIDMPPEPGTAPRAPSHEAILARLETAANRKKSAEVMNDALVGLVHDTEVRLGQGSQDTIAELKAAVAEVSSQPARTDTPEFKTWFGGSKAVNEQGEPLVVYRGDTASMNEFRTEGSSGGQGIYFTTDRSLGQEYARVRNKALREKTEVYETYLRMENPRVITGNDAEFGYSAYLTKEDIAKLKSQGYDGIINAADKEIIVFDPTQVKSIYNRGAWDSNDPDILGRPMDYSPAKPDPVPTELPAASARVDGGLKVPDSSKAEIDRMVKLAKEEGFDPEANTHDLELDIDALRAQDLLTAEDEAALKAIDESFGVAKAWDEVMQIAKGCQVKP